MGTSWRTDVLRQLSDANDIAVCFIQAFLNFGGDTVESEVVELIWLHKRGI